MADTRRLCTVSPTGTVTQIRNYDDQVNNYAEAGTFTVKMPARKPVMASVARRYAGERVVSETHDNGSIQWTHVIQGTTGDDALARMAALLADLEAPRVDLLFGWTPDGSSKESLYEIRAPASFSPAYLWKEFKGALLWKVDVSVPVAPLARAAVPQAISVASTSLPAVVQLGSTILGDAPAAADVSIRTSGGAAPPVWALIAWWKRITATPLAGSVAPFGIIEAETGTNGTTWGIVSDPSGSRSGSLLQATGVSGAGSATATYTLDPSVVQPDDWSDTVAVEVYARIGVSSTIVSPKVTLGRRPSAGANFGSYGYPPIYGASGKLLVPSLAGGVWRFMHIGTLTFPVDSFAPVKWDMTLTLSWAAGTAAGTISMDYLCLVPARTRALSPTGRVNDANYPRFIRSTADTTKTVRTDLSGLTASAAGNAAMDSGLGGAPIELPPGDVDMLLKLSSLVPDDPTIDSTTEQLAHTATASVTAVNRYFLTNR